MRSVTRTDVSKLAKFARTGAGAARLPATTARSGVQLYPEDGLREYRPADEVFSDASLASYASVAVTLGHPPVAVTPANMRDYQIGHVTDAPPEARVKVDGSADEWVRTTLVVGDAEALELIAKDGAEVSCGYSCELDMTPGVAPDGTPYDAVQRNIRMNHVAILTKDQKARAGAEARLRLDKNQGGAAPANCNGSEKHMKVILIDGAEYEFGSERHINKLNADHAASLATESARADKAEAERDTQQARADKAEATVSTAKLDELVLERHNLLQRAAKMLPADYNTDGKSNAQIRKDALEAALGADALKGKSDVYVEARFDAETDSNRPAQYHKGPAPAAKSDASAPNLDSDDDAFRKHLDAQLKGEK